MLGTFFIFIIVKIYVCTFTAKRRWFGGREHARKRGRGSSAAGCGGGGGAASRGRARCRRRRQRRRRQRQRRGFPRQGSGPRLASLPAQAVTRLQYTLQI